MYRFDYTQKQVELINELRKLWEQHIMWAHSFIISTAAGLGDLDLVTKRLLRNPSDFAAALKPFYGEEKASEFEKLLTGHLLIGGDLITAAKNGDAAAVAENEKKWYANADEIAEFLASINSYWSEREWQTMLYDHLKTTTAETTMRLQGKYADDIKEYDVIEEQALEMADVMSMGIIKQFMVR